MGEKVAVVRMSCFYFNLRDSCDLQKESNMKSSCASNISKRKTGCLMVKSKIL